MIGPNMATMLCCVLTDAALTSEQAHRLLQQSELNDRQRISTAFETVTSRLPGEIDLSVLQTALREFESVYSDDPKTAEEMITASRFPDADAIVESQQHVRLASMTMLVHSLLNMDATRTRE